ncbi:hypothetical protein GCM10027047_29940 [Rhodococcus aerolatus]
MRIDADLDACEGHGQCEAVAPGLFALDDDGELQVLRDGELDAGEEAAAGTAVAACPVAALRLVAS